MSETTWWFIGCFILGVGVGALIFNEFAYKHWQRRIRDLQRSDESLHAGLQALNQDICAACQEVCR